MRVKRALGMTMIMQSAQAILSIATGALIARVLGPAGQGVYAVILAGVALSAAMAVLGQFQGIATVAAEGRYSTTTLFGAALAHSAVVLLAAGASATLWSPLLHVDGHGVALVVSLILALEVFALMLRGIALGQHDIVVYNGSMLAQRLGLFGVVVGLATHGRLTLGNVLAGWLLSLVLSLGLASAFLLRRGYRGRPGVRDVLGAWARVLGRGGRAFVVLTLTLILIRFDVWTLGSILSVEAVGQMSVALSLAEWLWYVPTMLANLLFALVASDTGPRSVARIARASRMVSTISVLSIPALVLLGPWFVTGLYGSEYAAAGRIFALLVPGMVAIAVHLIIDSYFAGSGFPPVTIWAAAGALIAKLGLNVLLIPSMGLPGAAIATSLVYLALLTTKVAWFRHVAGTRIRDLLIVNGTDAQYVAAVAADLRRKRKPAPDDVRTAPESPALMTTATLQAEELK